MAQMNPCFAQFFYRVNEDKTVEAICGFCFAGSHPVVEPGAMREWEKAHVCRSGGRVSRFFRRGPGRHPVLLLRTPEPGVLLGSESQVDPAASVLDRTLQGLLAIKRSQCLPRRASSRILFGVLEGELSRPAQFSMSPSRNCTCQPDR